MAIYQFRCTACGLEFEVSRKMSESSKEATCPEDGASSTRVYTAPAVPGSPFARAVRSASSPSVWSHFGHSHDAGTEKHTH
jgi:putative FmdB family regulatory protein